VVACAACATTPAYRPVAPLLTPNQPMDASIGVHGVVGSDAWGIGSTAAVTRAITDDVHIWARGHGTQFFPYRSKTTLGADAQFGGSAGVRGVYRPMATLLLGGEVSLDYLEQRTSTGGSDGGATTQRFVSAVIGFPVAEEALPDLFLYVVPTAGAGYRFNDKNVPFAGFVEMPLGASYRLREWLVVVAEGGFAIPFNGGYGGVSLSFRW
jgi:hypothetical protein